MTTLKLGVLCMMPNAEAYLELIGAALGEYGDALEVHPIRLRSHHYRSSAGMRSYRCFDDLVRVVRLDLLLITGAPVEHLPFEAVHYWDELQAILHYARSNLKSVLGLCFGALAIAKFLGVDKKTVPEKVFGVHAVRTTSEAARYLGRKTDCYPLAMSIWALLDEEQLSRSSLKTLAHHPTLGSVMLASADEQFLMMLGHPEYSAETLRREWRRDIGKSFSYTRKFDDACFDNMAQMLAAGSVPVLANWLTSHANAPMAESR